MPNIPDHLTDPRIARQQGKGPDWAMRSFLLGAAGILLPFIAMLAIVVVFQYWGVVEATKDVESIYDRIEKRLDTATKANTPFDPLKAAQDVVAEVYDARDQANSPIEYQRLTRLARIAAYRVETSQLRAKAKNEPGKPPKAEVRELLFFNACGIWVLQATVVLFFPGMLVSLLSQAKDTIQANPAVDANRFESFYREARYRRSIWLLGEEAQLRLWRRLGFALIITLGSMYLFSPSGLKSTSVAEYSALKSIPSENSYPAWLDTFKNAPPAMAGFAGFFLYALTLTSYRFAIGDLSDRFFVSLFNRSITVMLISLVLSGISSNGEPISRALAFVVGVFPQTGLDSISKLAGKSIDRFTLDDSTPHFRDLPEIDLWKETVLGEVGILSQYDLARARIKDLISTVGFNPRVILDAVDRAILLDALGPAAAKLPSIPIARASQFVLYLLGREALVGEWTAALSQQAVEEVKPIDDQQKASRMELVKTTLGLSDPGVVLSTLALDANVAFIIEKRLSYDDV